MAKKIPDPLTRRHLLEGGLDPAAARQIADAYLAAGREVEAIEFLGMAEATEDLEEIQRQAVERGDVFLLRAASRALGHDAAPAEWTALAEAARRNGRERDAETAMRLATVAG